MVIKSCEKNEKGIFKIVVAVSTQELAEAKGQVYKKVRNSIVVPGFRRGKAPQKIVESVYGTTIFHSDAAEIIVPPAIDFAVEETKLRPVFSPEVSEIEFKYDGDIGAEVTLLLSAYPEVVLGEYKGLSAAMPDTQVSDDEIDIEIESARIRNARVETANRASIIGDIVTIDFEGSVDNEDFIGGNQENFEFTIGSNKLTPAFEENIIGMEAGDEREFDIDFPDNYSEPLAGKTATFRVKMVEVREQLLPDLDDEFAKDVSEFDTLNEYREGIRERMLVEKQSAAESGYQAALMEQILQSMEADVPEFLLEVQRKNLHENFNNQIAAHGIEKEAYLKLTETTDEDYNDGINNQAELQVRTMLALEKIALLEGIEISDEDIENEYEEAAKIYNTKVEKLKESVNRENIAYDLKLRHATRIIVENATVEIPDEVSDKLKGAELE